MAKPGSSRHRAARKSDEAARIKPSKKKATLRSPRAVRARAEERASKEALRAATGTTVSTPADDDREPPSSPDAGTSGANREREGTRADHGNKRITSSISGRFTMDHSRTVEIGMRVHVVSGPLEGQSGIVKEIDDKGEARLAIGSVIASVRVEDIVAARAPSTRPALSSSHRKLSRPQK